MTGQEAIQNMNEPIEFMKGREFLCTIEYAKDEHAELIGDISCESWEIDCTKSNWRDVLLLLWESFRKQNKLPCDCVTFAWSTTA